MSVRVVITGGGTGGHVYPGLAVAEVLTDQDPATEMLFVGGHGLERQIVPRAGLPFRAVRSAQWPRRGGLRTVAAAAALSAGTVQSAWLLTRIRPHVVLATGGYAAAPVGAAAGLLGIPLVLQEQNLIPGAANRFLARWARFISVAHPDVASRFGGAAVVTGVPVRRAALGGDRRRGLRRYGLGDGRLTILVLGGSLGAAALNAAVTEMARALDAPDDFQLLHQTGSDHVAWVEGQTASAPKALTYAAVAYIDDVADAYACADLVISRSGAGTMAEVTAHGLPVIAVPYPHGAAGEQEANARILEAAGAAVVITAPALTGVRLAHAVAALRDPQRRQAMAAASRALGRPNAAADVAALVWRAAGQGAGNVAQVGG
ncbi:MAG: undecaprenyldiphospho-muramoylpentapeptide beta-N-acetylglucosaminyltransferase [bacterium]